ncbi:MAG: hypothetical protein ABSG57_04270 [Candidatus Bathyarchaeia archaeon]
MAIADLRVYLRSLPFFYPKTMGCSGINQSGQIMNAGSDEVDETVFVELPSVPAQAGQVQADFENLSGSPTAETVKKWLSKHTPPMTEAQRTAAIAAFNV